VVSLEVLERIMYAVSAIPAQGININGKEVYNLKFADDIDVLDVTFERLQEQLTKLDAESRRYGMQINTDKTIFRRNESKGTERIE